MLLPLKKKNPISSAWLAPAEGGLQCICSFWHSHELVCVCRVWHKYRESYKVKEMNSLLRPSSIFCCIFSDRLFAMGMGLSQRQRCIQSLKCRTNDSQKNPVVFSSSMSRALV